MTHTENKRRQSNPEYYVSRWRTALEQQDRRIRDAEGQLHQQVDIDLYALVLRNLVRAVEYAKGQTGNEEIQNALQSFKQAVPGWRNVRDFLEHFDEYAQEKGKLQNNKKATVYGPFYAEEEKYDVNGKLIAKNYYLSFGEGNQIEISTATREAQILTDITLLQLKAGTENLKNEK